MPRVKLFDEEEVLDKAMHLFWKKGFHATSIQDLVEELGINRASLYDTFGGKEELFNQTFKRYQKITHQQVRSLLHENASIKQGIKRLFEFVILQSVDDPNKKGCFAVNITTELIPGDALIINDLTENRLVVEKIFYDYLLLGVERGEISKEKDLKTLASLLFTLQNGIKVVAKLNPDQEQLTKIIDACLVVLD